MIMTTTAQTNKTDCHDMTEILLKMALNTITKTQCITYPEFLSFLEIGIGAKIWWG
jgi:hypothetical protein